MPFLAPVIGAIAGAVGAAASFIGGLGIVGKAIVGIGLQLAANAIAKKKAKGTAAEPRGTQLDVQYGGAEPRQIGVGRFATAGQDVYTNTHGASNKLISKVFVLSDFPIEGVSRVAINGVWCNIVGTNDAPKGSDVDGEAQAHLWIKVYRGYPGQAADPYLIQTANPVGRWTADHRGAGVAYAIVHAQYHDEKMSSFPSLLFECRGLAYDPRFDSTAGGSGTQRFADITTWAHSANPVVQAYTYERGFFVNGELIIGKGMPAADLPLGPWMSAMNVCDEAVAGGEARYTAGLLYTAADGTTHRDNLEPILNAAGAALVERVDGDLPIVGATQPVVATLTDADLIIGDRVTFQAKRSRSELINAVHGAFNRPADLWAATAYPAQRDATALAVDRERHAVQIDFGAVYSERQAATLALQAVRENRYQASATVVVRPRWIGIEVGDWISWNLKGYGLRTWRVVGRSLAPLGPAGARNVTLSLQEVGGGIYDQSVVVPEGPVRVPVAGPAFVSTVSNFLALATTAEADGGRVYPAILAEWAAIDDATVDAVIVEYWKATEPTRRVQQRVVMPATRALIVGGLLPRTDYVLQATVETNPPRDTLWSAPQNVFTVPEDLAVELASLNNDIRDIIQRGAERDQDFRATLDEIANAVAVMSAKGEIKGASARASIVREERARIEADRVSAELIEGVRTELYDPATGLPAVASSVNQLRSDVELVDDRVTATADALTGVSASVGNLSASGLISFRAQVVSGDGSFSQIAIQAKASAGDAFKDTGLYINTTPTSSSIVIRTDRFIVTDGATSGFPFVIEGGVVKLAIARFQQLISDNGKLVINGALGTIEVYD